MGRWDASSVSRRRPTGLAIQDLAIAEVALAKADQLDLPTLAL
jgi:ornithine cyclodeaminase/alanine dehydrogenase-like protein (mu-crystallin family)